jgi:hypothetical protein
MEKSNIKDIVSQLKAIIGVKIPSGRLRRWASEGLIPKPKLAVRNGNRCWVWPPEVVEQAAVIHVLRHVDLFWIYATKGAPRAKGNKGTTVLTKQLLEVKRLVERFYSSANKGSFEEDEFHDLFGTLKLVKMPKGGYMFGGFANHPIFVKWIATLEKIRDKRPLSKPVKVTFRFNNHLTLSEGGSITLTFDGISVEPFDFENVGISVGYSPEVEELLRGKKWTDVERAEREGRVLLKVDLFSPTLKVEKEDFEKQQIVVTDPFQGLRGKVIDLKKYGITMCSDEQWAEIKNNWKPVDVSKVTGKLLKYRI